MDEPYWDFVFRFCSGFESSYGYRITGHRNTDALKALLQPFMLRRKKEDVMKDLPPITFHEVTVERSAVELDPIFFEQMRGKTETQFFDELKVADQTLRQALHAISSGTSKHKTEDSLRVFEALGASSVTLRRYVGMAKLPKICEILIDELSIGLLEKIVIFAVHRDVIEGLRVRLAKFGAVTLYGGTDPRKRQSNIERFMKDPKCRVFIGNIQAAGTGIDGLQSAAHEVAFVEMDWVPSNNAQAAMRCHRIGQTRPVRVRAFTLDGSSDEDVMRTLVRKSRELTKIF